MTPQPKNTDPEKFHRATRSYWQTDPHNKSAETTASTSATVPKATDIAIVGAGLAGLSTAIAIKAKHPDMSVVIIERHFVGYGASGRNGGLLSPLPAPVWLVGADSNDEHRWATKTLNTRVHEAADWLKTTIPDCEIRQQHLHIEAKGLITGTALARIARTLEHTGIESGLIHTQGSGKRHTLSLPGHTVQPYKLVQGLAEHAKSLGVEIFQNIRVTSIDQVDDSARISFTLETPDRENDLAVARSPQTLTAKTAVVCTNAYTGDIALKERAKAKPVHNYMLATNPLDDATLDTLGTRNTFTVELNHAYVFYRIHNRRLVYGGIEKLSNAGGGDFDVPRSIMTGLNKLLATSFPGAADLSPAHAWGGKYHMTTTDLPIISPQTKSPSIIMNVGYGGTGVALTLVCARLAAEISLSGKFQDPEDRRMLDLINNTRLPLIGAARFGMGCIYDILRAPFAAQQ